MTRRFSLGDLANQLQAELVGSPSRQIAGVGSLQSASVDQIAHLSNPSYRQQLASCQAGAVILSPDDRNLWSGDALIVDDPYLSFARLSQLFVQETRLPAGIDRSARVSESAKLGADVALGPGVVIGDRTVLGDGACIHPNCVVGDDCVLGERVELRAGVVLNSRVQIGHDTIVHANTVLGADGFGFTPDESGQLQSIAQLGGVRIGNHVRVGAGTTIDRGTIDDTVIDDGVKIDNQVQIGHNCHIGAHSVICGCVGIVGSSRIGRYCVLAGGVGIGGSSPITICDGVTISGMTHVSGSIEEPGIYSGGVLHSKTRHWKRNALRLQNLDALFRRVARLEKRN
jgi:UDP-3-O-[3-hydroxymyristoyl] glucosamine N-acyltransferase